MEGSPDGEALTRMAQQTHTAATHLKDSPVEGDVSKVGLCGWKERRKEARRVRLRLQRTRKCEEFNGSTDGKTDEDEINADISEVSAAEITDGTLPFGEYASTLKLPISVYGGREMKPGSDSWSQLHITPGLEFFEGGKLYEGEDFKSAKLWGSCEDVSLSWIQPVLWQNDLCT